jgi:hypothetical protein
MTTALEGGEGSTSLPGRSLPPGKTRYPCTGWAPRPVLTGAENLAPTGFRSPDRPASRYTDYATLLAEEHGKKENTNLIITFHNFANASK